jgi:RNA polymerase sigma-70 factor (ECF subfamily)
LITDNQEKLIKRIQDEPQQFEVLFDACYAGIFNYVLRRTGDADVAKDVCSETFLKAFLNIKDFKWKGIPIDFWLYRIAGNEIMQYYRKEKYRPESLDMLIEANGWDTIDPHGHEVLKAQIEEEKKRSDDFLLVQQQLQLLPMIYQEVIALRYFERKNIREISLILDKKEGTVKSLLSRGIEKLRTRL